MLAAGRLKDKITFMGVIRSPDSAGGFTTSEPDDPILETFAEVLEINSTASTADGQEKLNQSLKVTIRYRTDIILQNGNRIKWRGNEFTVNNFKVDPQRTYIEMILTADMETTKRTSQGWT